MSGCGFGTICPNCGKEADAYNDYKPFDHTDLWCYHCGFTSFSTIGYMSLEEINENRVENNLRKLKKLPKQDYTL